ncbi:MAG: TRAP transporter TatT component family protein [Myxococcota bacterium]
MPRLLFIALVALAASGCIKSIATGALADALSGPGNLGSDDDPELVRDAAPFGLKTMESVLEAHPEHVGLLTSLASGFTQYAYAFVQQDADAAELEAKYAQAKAGRLRAKKLYLRARDYGLRGLELSSPGITERLKSMRGLSEAVAGLKKEDVPLVYWTAAAWALAVSNGKEDMQLVSELPAPEALMTKALELDEAWGDGALHEFFVSFEAAKPGGTEAGAKAHLDKAVALAHGRRLGVQVSWAEGPLVQAQKREDFEAVLKAVLAADVDASRADRLANIIAQRRAKLLLDHADDLFN